MLTINDNDFTRLIAFIKSNYGIDLRHKKQLIVGRLSNTVKSMGFKNFTEYIDHILNKKEKSDVQTLLNHLTTNYTYFMREQDHFDYFKNVVLPYLEKTKKNSKVLSV